MNFTTWDDSVNHIAYGDRIILFIIINFVFYVVEQIFNRDLNFCTESCAKKYRIFKLSLIFQMQLAETD